MRPQSKHRPEYAATHPERSGSLEEADARNPGSVADFDIVACKDVPLWTKARPLTLGLLSLALAVVLWGLEYKVSLYHAHANHSARLGVAKLWVGPRTAAFAKNDCIRKSAPHAPELHLLTSSSVNASDANDRTRYQEAELTPRIGCLSHPRTPRSPPLV